MVSALLQKGWIFEDLNDNFVTMSFEISDCENTTLNKKCENCRCGDSSNYSDQCSHEGPCSPKGSVMVGRHCRLCAGWHDEHKKDCPGEPLYNIIRRK